MDGLGGVFELGELVARLVVWSVGILVGWLFGCFVVVDRNLAARLVACLPSWFSRLV